MAVNPTTPPLILADDQTGAAELTRLLGCTVVTADDIPPDGLALRLGSAGLELLELGPAGAVAVRADFLGGAFGYRLRQGCGPRSPLGRAVGLSAKQVPTVVDATAGLGRDTMLLATLGCPVRALERSAVVLAMLADGLRRATLAAGATGASKADRRISRAVARIELIQADGRQWLCSPAAMPRPVVVLLDPMFPERHKAALVKKEMRLFRSLLGADLDGHELLQAALSSARRRVVVKRPRGAEPLASASAPSHSHASGITRYDVYLRPPGIGSSDLPG